MGGGGGGGGGGGEGEEEGAVTAELREGLNPPLVLMCEQMPYPM